MTTTNSSIAKELSTICLEQGLSYDGLRGYKLTKEDCEYIAAQGADCRLVELEMREIGAQLCRAEKDQTWTEDAYLDTTEIAW